MQEHYLGAGKLDVNEGGIHTKSGAAMKTQEERKERNKADFCGAQETGSTLIMFSRTWMQRRQASPTDVAQRGSCYVNYAPAATQHRRVSLHHQVDAALGWAILTPRASQVQTRSAVSVLMKQPILPTQDRYSRQWWLAVKQKLRGANLPRWRNPDSCFYTHTVTELLRRATLPQILSGVRTFNHFMSELWVSPHVRRWLYLFLH